MTSFIERKVNEICGRWLDGFTKDNVDVSLLQAKITLSDLHFKTDELCLLSPTFAPSFFYVGKLSIDIPLAWDLSRPVKIIVTDVLGVVRVRDHHESMTAEGVRKSISANVHVKAILSKLADELGGGAAEEGKRAATINLHTVHNIHKVMRNLEVTVKNAHVRVEEPAREVPVPLDEAETETETEVAAGRKPSTSTPAVAFGICLRGVSLGLDERADAGAGGGSGRERWFGKKFRAMETALLGNFSRYDAVDGALGSLQNDARSDGEAHSDTPSVAESDGARSGASNGSGPDDDEKTSSTLAVTKFASLRGASIYFCRDEECYSATDKEETLRRLREDLRSPPTALPPLLRRCRAGLGIKLVFSAKEWGKMESLDVRLLAGDINVQLGDDHLGYLLRWTSLLKDNTRALALSALRPQQKSIPPSRSSDGDAGDDGDANGLSEKSRYYRALWRHAVEVVLRDLRVSVWQRGERARKELQLAQAARSESIDRAWSIEESEYRTTRGLLWRTWFTEWVQAARYLSVRQLIHSRLVVESFADESGGIHSRLHEDLEVQPKPDIQTAKAKAKAERRGRGGRSNSSSSYSKLPSGGQRGAAERQLAKYLMPWQLPQEDVDKAWGLIYRKTLRWELRYAGGIKLAIDEERVDQHQLDPAALQALWSIQLQLDAQLPHRICAFARRMAFLRVGWRSRIDRLWQARAEKQRRLGLGLGEPPNPPRLTANDSISFTASEAGIAFSNEIDYDNAAEELADTQDGGDGADRVGTLLVRMGQLDGVGGVGLLSLAPKAVATLMLEESSATLEEMDLETNFTEVAKYDHKNERCLWNQTFRLQVELNEDYVHDLRQERMKKHRRTLTGSSAADLLNSSMSSMGSSSTSTSPMKTHGPPSSDSRTKMKDTRSTSVGGYDHSASSAKSPGVLPVSLSMTRDREGERERERERHRRTDSTDSTRFQTVTEAVPLSSFLLAVSCIDKSVFGVTQLGSMTLPGKQLTAVPLKVLEHRCALFSPTAVDQQPRELTLETIFVPPGEDVGLAERELSAIGKQIHLQEKLDMGKLSPLPSGRKTKTKTNAKPSRGSAGVLEASPSRSPSAALKPSRTSLDNVGEREVKVLSLEPTEGAAVVGGSGDAGDQESGTMGDEADVSSSQRSIPIVDTETPGKVAISMRAAGVTVVTYLSRGEGKSHVQGQGQGQGQGEAEGEAQQGTSMQDQDLVVTLSETSAREIEACSEIDTVRGKFALALEAATVQLLDKSLLQVASASASSASTSPVREKRRQNAAPRPQLLVVGPVGVEVASMRFARQETETETETGRASRWSPNGDRSELAAAQEAPATPTPPIPGAQNPSFTGGRVNTYTTTDGRDRQFLDALGSWPTWDWRGRLKIGAYTAELGKSHDRPGLEEVWRQFRFSMPKSALEDTHVLRGGTADSSGAAKSSTWLLKAGERGLAVDVQLPTHEHIQVSRAPSPKSYVYVSSSESEPCSPPFSPSSSPPSPSPLANGDGYGIPSSRTPSRLSRAASIYFPSTEEEEERTERGGPSPLPSSERLSLLGGGASDVDRSAAKVREHDHDLQATPNNEQLVRRVRELERELEALKAATASTVAAVANEAVR